MLLSQLLSLILAKTSLSITVNEGHDIQLDTPDDLFSVEVHHKIGDIVADAARNAGLSERGACAFGEFVAELATGWSTRYSNEFDILHLDGVFSRAAYSNPHDTIRLYLLPNWDALNEHLDAVTKGIAAAFNAAKLL